MYVNAESIILWSLRATVFLGTAALVICSESVGDNTCHFTLQDCEYEISLLPSNHCHLGQGHQVKHSRSTRSAESGFHEIQSLIASLAHKFERSEQKMTREMRALSKRVLRGARKMENFVRDLAGDRKSKGVRARPCPDGFVSVDNWPSCYMFSRFNATWFSAIDFCTALDSELVSLEEVKEHFLVTFLIQNHPDLQSAAGWWTSGSFVAKSKQWVWKTTAKSQPFTYIKWAANEPNEEHDQNLMGMMMYRVDGYLWHDQIFIDKYNFVCEKVTD